MILIMDDISSRICHWLAS